ncbi:MAG: DUF2132 domain-containing protein [Gammaproteobacteria bacterium]|nr:DUF2132 domain-containing protein [Gammaproteobacteria bacterium]
MSNESNFKNNPLNGVGLKAMLMELTSHYGFNILFAYLKINCFKTNPSIASSVKFLKKTEWAREKVEIFYMYQYKNLPRVSSEQFETPPRDRIVPDHQKPGEPAELSLADAERMHERAAKKVAERKASNRHSSGTRKHFGSWQKKPQDHQYQNSSQRISSHSSKTVILDGEDPWAKWRDKKTD